MKSKAVKLLPVIIFTLILGVGLFLNDKPIKAQDKPNESLFNDVIKEHPFYDNLKTLKDQGIIKGYQDGSFKPDLSISRAEFMTLLLRPLYKNPPAQKNCFSDVKEEWFAPYICQGKKQGLVKGYPNGSFGPDQNITFSEASAITAKAYRLPIAKLKTGEPWYKPYVQSLERSKAIPTSVDYVDKKISRSETVEMVARLKNKVKTKPTKTYENLTASFPTLSSCSELEEKIDFNLYKETKQNQYYREVEDSDDDDADSVSDTVQNATGSASPSVQKEAGGSSNYSKTNVQVEGVDEADIIKNDGEFIYIVSGNKVRVIRAYTPDKLAEVSVFTASDKNFRPSEIYTTQDKLVVLGTTYKPNDNQSAGQQKMMPYYHQRNRTKVIIIDTTDKQNLKEDRSLEFDGYQISSRRIDERLYLVINYRPNYYFLRPLFNDNTIQPEDTTKVLPYYSDSSIDINENRLTTDCEDIHFLPHYNQMNMLTIARIDINNPISEVSTATIMGTGETIYSSVKNLYVAATEYDYPTFERFDIWGGASGNEKTTFYRFNIENGVTFATQGSVKGHLLNQFSLDENGDTFRVATTTGEVWDSKNPSKNHLFVLDVNNLQTTLGKIEDIAPGEKIYSIRFLGDRAYMVTFKKVDPFFVIDLKDPAKPAILGALKIPGYSDYLHPYDANHIIGFGKEAVDPALIEKEGLNSDFDFAWYQGMKIALFDVTDVANPQILFKQVIGDRGTDSPLLYNHKALYFDKQNDLLAFPVSVAEIPNKTSDQYTGNTYGQTVFQGAYIYQLDLTNGFQLKAKVTHYDAETIQKQGTYWYDQKSTIERIVSIGNYLYTVSLGKIKAIEKDNFGEVNTLELSFEENNYGDYQIE